MTNPNYTDITFILDRSGSMAGSESDTIGGVNKFLSDQNEVDGKCRVTTVLFDNQYEFLYENQPISETPKLDNESYFVRGSTALYDAMGRAIKEAGNRFSKMPEKERPGRVLFVIITDGYENASREFDFKTLSEMISVQQDKYKWDFVFLGADLDAMGTHGNLGIKSSNYGTVGKARLFNAISNLSANTTLYRGVSVESKSHVDMTSGVADDKSSVDSK